MASDKMGRNKNVYEVPMNVGEKWAFIAKWFASSGYELWENDKKDMIMEKFADKIINMINKISLKLQRLNETLR